LVHFLFVARHLDGGRTRPLWLVGPAGSREFFDKLMVPFGQWIEPSGYQFRLYELAHGQQLALQQWSLQAVRTRHTEASVGFRITTQGRSVLAITGDTEYCEELVALCRQAQAAIVECAFPSGQFHPGHMTAELVGELASRARPEKVILVHCYPQCQGHDLVAEVSSIWEGEVLVAEDFMELNLL
jgi:ribonuclease BN (tRNA processing enzyme)